MTTTPRAQLDAIGLVVEDMARSLAFYRQVGLDIPAEADDQPHVEHTLAGGVRVLWDTLETVRSFSPGWEPPKEGYRIGLAFRVDTPAELDALYQHLTDQGYEGVLPPWDAVWEMRYAVLHDPDGNGVDLFSPLEGS